jgi:hypothetical protein
MWTLDNETPYAAERNWTRDKRGLHLWIVAVRATFGIESSGKFTLLDEQPPPDVEPQYRGEPGKTSLRVDSDLLAPKPTTDVILDACAHAPGHVPTSMVPVSLRLGEIEKTLLVFGLRTYYRGAFGLAASAPQDFVTHPIHYESAFGGFDTTPTDPLKHRLDVRNPVGRGISLTTKGLENQLVHAIEYPNGDPAEVGPAGFGPIDRSWSPRIELAGTYDKQWARSKSPLLPDDYQDSFALSAPLDQRSRQHLRGGEPLLISNMTPNGTLRFDLPKLYFAFTTRFGQREEEHRSNLTTVLVETEKMRLSMIWQAVLSVPARQVEQLDETVITEKQYL